MRSTTREKLMRQILERKKRAIEQVRRQTEEFDRYLSSLCMLRGLPPPSLSSFQLNKEELISEVLLPRPYTIHYPGGHDSLHQRPVPDAPLWGLEEASSRDISALNRGIAASDRLSISPQLPTGDAQCALDEFPVADAAAASPQECKDVSVPDSHAKSLARIERSKSRQRALELRNSAKAAKTWSRDLEDVPVGSDQIQEPHIDFLQHDHPSDLRLVEPVSASDEIRTQVEEKKVGGGTLGKEKFFDERITRSQSTDQMAVSQGVPGNLSQLSHISNEIRDRETIDGLEDQSGCADTLCETVNHSSVAAAANCAVEDTTTIDCNEKSSYVCSGLQIRSCRLPSGAGKGNFDMGSACSGGKDLIRPRISTLGSSPQLDNVSQSRQCADSSVIPGESSAARMKTGGSRGMEKGGDDFSGIITRARSSAQQSDSAKEHSKLYSSCSYGQGQCIGNMKDESNHADDFTNMAISVDFDRSCTDGVPISVLQGSKVENISSNYEIERSTSFRQQHTGAGASSAANGSSPVLLEENGGELWQAPSLSVAEGRDGHQQVLVTDTKGCLQFESKNIIERENCNAIRADSDRLVQNGFTSGPNLTGPCLGEMVESKPPANSAALVKPKQLNFDDAEKPPFMEMSYSMVSNSQEKPHTWIEEALPEEKQLSQEMHRNIKKSSENHVRNSGVSLEPETSKADQPDAISVISDYQNVGSHFLDSWRHCKQMKTIGENIDNLRSASPTSKTNLFQLIFRDPMENADTFDVGKRDVKYKDRNGELAILEPEVLSPAQLEQVEPNQDIVERNENNASIMMHYQAEECPVLGSTMPSSEISQVWLEKGEMANPSAIILGERGLHAEKESPLLYQHEDRLSLRRTELLTFVDKTVHGWKSNLVRDKNTGCGSIDSPICESIKGIFPDQDVPEFEGFVVDEVNLNKLDLPSNVLERASVLERLCKSACMNTPMSDFSRTYKLQPEEDSYGSIPNNVLEGMHLRNSLGMCAPSKELDADKNLLAQEIDCNFHEMPLPEGQPSSASQSAQEAKKTYISPVRKLWDGMIMKSGSSGKRASSTTDLPCISEENESDEAADTFEEGHALEMIDVLVKRDPLADITRNSNLPTSVCENEAPCDRCSVASVNMDPISCNKANLRLQKFSNKGGCTHTERENQSMSSALSGIKRANNSFQQRVTKAKLSEKTGVRKAGRITLEGPKPNNIVSNITSFIPLVRQKQAQPVIAGKREVKVKALEAAEAAKRLAEKKENERRMKKEALKLDREKKEEERRKNEADVAARKRQREEEERKEKERKRKRIEKPKKKDSRTTEQRRPQDEPNQCEKMGKTKGEKTLDKVLENQHHTTSILADDASKASVVVEGKGALNYCGDDSKVGSDFCEATKIGRVAPDIEQEPSYEISPYKCSDDEAEEDEDEDEKPNYKFVPTWASRSAVAMIISSQKRVNPESVFPPCSFCKIDEVLLPRRLQKNVRRSQQSNVVPG